MPRTRIKVCGLTRADQALAAARLGVDAIGLVFAANSPRRVDIDQARIVIEVLPPFVTVVGLFCDTPSDEIEAILRATDLDLLQFHGDEPPDLCGAWRRPWIKAIPMSATLDPLAYAATYPAARGFLLDSHGGGRVGGSGEVFDWSRIPERLSRPLILAGGLDADNVEQAIRQVQPWAVDVSSGVESGKGLKDPAKLAAFVESVRRADEQGSD